MDARLGGRYSYATEKGSVSVNSVSEFECHGEIMEYDPPTGVPHGLPAQHDVWQQTIVRWELNPRPGGTRLKVTHSSLATQLVSRKDYSGGWPGVLELLKNFTEK